MLPLRRLAGLPPVRYLLQLTASVLVVSAIFLCYMRWHDPEYRPALRPVRLYDTTQLNSTGVPLHDPAQLLRHLWQPVAHDITETSFRTWKGKVYRLRRGAREWTEPSGKRLLILDVDSRFENQAGTLFNEKRVNRQNIEKRTAGRINHMVYAMAHGYDYRFVRAPDFRDRHGTWTKVPVLREALKAYETVVFLDADATFVHLDLPLEWLMNYWDIKKDTSLALAKDPDSPNNRDSRGAVVLNTGFIIAQRSNRTQDILAALEDCTNEKRWAGCARWKRDWAHEQRAFSEYVRYEYTETSDIHAIDVWEANSPVGVFIRHDWPKKEDPLEHLERSVMDMLLARTQQHFNEDLDHYYRDLHKSKHPLRDVGV